MVLILVVLYGTFQISCNVENAEDVDREYIRLLEMETKRF